MGEPVVLDIDALRTALERVLDAVEERLGTRVRLDHDYYWHLPVESAFDMSREPDELTVGQLSNDLSPRLSDAS